MTDYFLLLDEPRRPWLDVDALKEKFLALSGEHHPDRVHAGSEEKKLTAQQRFAALNQAYQCLREPRDRLQHLLELEGGAKPKTIDRAPASAMDLFLQVGQLCRDVDAFLAERASAASPLLKVRFFEHGLEWTDRLQALQRRINEDRDRLFAELQQLNSAWEQAVPAGAPDRATALPLEALERIYRELSYLTRWSAQIQERIVQLSL